MKLQTVIDNLDNTVAGKERLLESYRKHSPDDRLTMILAEMLQLNLKELRAIRADVRLVDSLD